LDTPSTSSISARDSKYVWHPLTQHKKHPFALPLSSAKGALLYDEDGNRYIDAIASWYTSMFGHCHPYILEKVCEQMKRLDQVVFTGFTHEPAVALAEALMQILPHGQQKVFYSDNGSTAVEIAIKMALQYHSNRGEKRTVLLAMENGFHGDTFGAMSVSGLAVYNGPFEEHFLKVERVPTPGINDMEELLDKLEKRLDKGHYAAFIYEPLVQGAAGMKMHLAAGLDKVLALMQSHGVVTIADEVMTGFGKTAAYFASDHMQTKPDIVCLSKALTAGLLPMGATTCTQGIYDAFYSNDLSKGLFHGHTYTANPLACTAALAAIELLRKPETWDQIGKIETAHRKFNETIVAHPKVITTRQTGVIYALDLDIPTERYGEMRDVLFQHFMERGVYLRPLGNTVYVLPPYCISGSQLQKVYDSILEALEIF
jgi:adenosylmethionine-8-amino-7-oxononanoate aminotransferase